MPIAFLQSGNYLCYEEWGRPDGEPLVLIQGIGVQMIGWRDEFCRMLADRGFRVVRFDNRDIGLSRRHTARPLTLVNTYVRRRLGLRFQSTYSLRDLAQDVVGLLDHLDVDSAHVVGVSMGGMVAQLLAIEFPNRVRSLTSMMSSTRFMSGERSWRMTAQLIRLATDNNAERYVERQLALLSRVGSPKWLDLDEARGYYETAFNRAPDRSGVPRQLGAIISAPDRRAALTRVVAPTLVIHGERDMVVPCWAGKATATAVPHARFVTHAELAHDLPTALWPRFVEDIVVNAHRAYDRREWSVAV